MVCAEDCKVLNAVFIEPCFWFRSSLLLSLARRFENYRHPYPVSLKPMLKGYDIVAFKDDTPSISEKSTEQSSKDALLFSQLRLSESTLF